MFEILIGRTLESQHSKHTRERSQSNLSRTDHNHQTTFYNEEVLFLKFILLDKKIKSLI